MSLGDTKYRWYVRRKPTYAQGIAHSTMHVAIESADPEAKRTLLVDLAVTRPDNWIASHQTALEPAEVRAIIAQALAEGWNPHEPGSPFRMRHALIRERS